MTDAVSSVCSPDLPCCWRWERQIGLVPEKPRQTSEFWFSGWESWHGLILGVLSVGLGFRLCITGMDGEQSAKLSPCFQCLCLLMDGLVRLLGTSRGGPKPHGAPGPKPPPLFIKAGFNNMCLRYKWNDSSREIQNDIKVRNSTKRSKNTH